MAKFKINIDETKVGNLNASSIFDNYLTTEQFEQLKRDRAAAYDKWVWETGTEEDYEELKRLDAAVEDAEMNAEVAKICEAVIDEAAKEMAKEIDDEIIKNLQGGEDGEV